MNSFDLKLCNCAECRVEMLGETHKHLAKTLKMPAIAGRIGGRPYCGRCIQVRKVAGSAKASADDESPCQSNAIRQLEDGAA